MGSLPTEWALHQRHDGLFSNSHKKWVL
jgi:hypothetical protein